MKQLIPEETIARLNSLLVEEAFFAEMFTEMYSKIQLDTGQGLCFVDFTKHNKEQQKEYAHMKTELISRQEFEKSALMRDHEKYCDHCERIKQYHQLSHSKFHATQKTFFYFYFGTAPNDEQALSLCKQLGFEDGFNVIRGNRSIKSN